MDSGTSDRFRIVRSRYQKFPYDSTLNQLYNAERFDLYRDLGYESACRAIAAGTRVGNIFGAGRGTHETTGVPEIDASEWHTDVAQPSARSN